MEKFSEIEEFSVKGENGNWIKFSFQEVYGFPESTSHWGGYEVRASLEIKSGNFNVKSILWTSTGEIQDFLKCLEASNKVLKGKVKFENYERNLEFTVTYTELGHTVVEGTYFEFGQFENELKFEFSSDQSYLTQTIKELNLISLKYGNNKE
ncbi:hypothetical protein AHMF7605_24730 [Adhaeribacter arboris]|uniref:Uncharacterized protein n=1 Tax=Adhaeribacter arboris TaxID=2072846 RepID=A0A2T2YLT0_9BACT|nr:hypothetical protein [Adhaeribacter arboris]PSR56471.1 hypothetical protein AHMF7605_24730 [Adhaeribacter arboris]